MTDPTTTQEPLDSTASNSTPLLPCPFCGSPATMEETEGDDRIVYCTNDKCGVQVHDDMHWGRDEYCAEENVTRKWNTRYQKPQVPTHSCGIEGCAVCDPTHSL